MSLKILKLKKKQTNIEDRTECLGFWSWGIALGFPMGDFQGSGMQLTWPCPCALELRLPDSQKPWTLPGGSDITFLNPNVQQWAITSTS